MSPAPVEAVGKSRPAEVRPRAALRYTIDGDLRYLSHHDELRMMRRALTRARWPLRFSEGFNPLARLMLPLPRSVGMASDCQWALVELREPRAPEQLWDGLEAALPPQCQPRQLIAPAPQGTPHPVSVEYAAELRPADADAVAKRSPRLIPPRPASPLNTDSDEQSLPPSDPRSYLETLVLDGSVLRMRLRYLRQRTARPSQVLTELDLPAEAYNHRLRRTKVVWDMELAGTGVAPAAPRGIRVGNSTRDCDTEED